ncbi:tRNA (adenine(22)-N(1))-methyltransferase [Paenibacillus abyssi]|uniref:SAM-dependent methyltransferase n=1 Tax=Paenibacillus abyssi TaxID=1340531 RepID=A0A917D6C0_9BACL|nr:class I SAM-dependent methyltransferase [Paenibacillus abyssi]GGG10533.1 SAM-dependent methyltransferase [Paenibacillus abyssi]
MLKISKRLMGIFEQIGNGHRVADIGSDHALLPVYLIQSGKSPFVIAGELNPGPLAAARKQVRDAGLSSRIDVREGNGLSVLSAGEVDAITIAGMGGGLIRDILEEGLRQGKLEGVTELVLQPNVGEDLVRRWLVKENWYLTGEQIIEEDGKTYEILHAVRSDRAKELNDELYNPDRIQLNDGGKLSQEWLYTLGPWLVSEPVEVWKKKWESELCKLEKICIKLSESDAAESREKEAAFREEIRQIREVLDCLPTAKR